MQTMNKNSTNIGRSISGSFSGSGSDCCPPVVDQYTWIALLAGIALATYFLRITITTTMFMSKKRRKREDGDMQLILNGEL